MASPTEEFFDELGRRGHEPLLERVTATVRFTITDGVRAGHWLVAIEEGDIRVTRGSGSGRGCCGICADRSLFDGIVTGRVNAIAAMLRGALWVDGDRETWILVQRLLPGPCAQRRAPLAAQGARGGAGHG
ncbi:SCP2 sterol-binding domain-containing protein [Planosporangium sp. 12N6]|uniref:SCP2 sterol-binding domain-containing protein n=1 Tax=Planosporangium spinosum TaxID=3402278 RepID=UPI003CF2DFF6